jgi:hypothetical protein
MPGTFSAVTSPSQVNSDRFGAAASRACTAPSVEAPARVECAEWATDQACVGDTAHSS